ncbi:MAG: calcium-translocating P-type ATPase, SERCA-type [Candidatus Bathyarchaeota archaeon]|nr:calcium-translocating P-type ATPase, SERCA-type [Candidatus Bathyarchaeota archaeon]
MTHYNHTTHEVLKELTTSEKGLTSSEAEVRLRKHGKNVLEEKEKISPIRIFMEQFNSPVVWILLGALIISFIIGEKIDAIVILIILIINAVIGFFQEYNAERAIEALKQMASLKALVIRDGKEQEINSSEVVPGDILVIREGNKIPADARIIKAVQLQTQESILTGESLPIRKTSEKLLPDKAVAEQKNMLFSGTTITRGKGWAVVVRTGMSSEIGKIAKLIQETKKEQTPLQEKLAKLGGTLSVLTVLICALVFLTGLVTGANPLEIFTISVALAVAAIPEGLPAVVTISLAVGLRRMLKKKALIRKLPSVETLGSTTVICSDKTGTLTHNEMTVKRIFADDEVVEVTGSGYSSKGEFSVSPENLSLLLKIGAICNDARIENRECIGDPTEGCLIVSARKAKINTEKLNQEYSRLNEIPFSSERKRMTTIHKIGNQYFAYMKGAPDVILNLCSSYYADKVITSLTEKKKDLILRTNLEFSKNALRVIGFTFKEIEDPNKFEETDEKDFVFVGLQAMIDPPRNEVKPAIKQCYEAGIKVVMITGDHEGTAVAVANEIGITGKSITGKQLERLSDQDFEDAVHEIAIYARVNPEHKQKIVETLQKKGEVVAMTGDGVNDAPALKKADIGIAMGITGTDVSREASDMVLTDDNFRSIVSAVEEGRGVFDNIRKFFVFLLSGNIGEVAIIFILIMMGFPAPLTATQILLINLVTDGLPATALSIDPFEPNAMKRKPRRRNESIQRGLDNYLFGYPLLMTIVAITLFVVEFNRTGSIEKARTFGFLTIVFFELYQAFASRSTLFPSIKVGLFKNKALIGATLISFIVAVGAVYLPSMNTLFGTAPLKLKEFLMVLLLSSIGFVYLEVSKNARSKKIGLKAD